MGVSSSDWLLLDNLDIWTRISLFVLVVIVLLICVICVREYVSLANIESFVSYLRGNNDSGSVYPLTFIVPKEYLQPEITSDDFNQEKISARDSLTTRSRYIYSIYKSQVNRPLLTSKDETMALESVERRKDSCTICSALTLERYLKANPKSDISVIDVVDSLVAQVIVPADSDIYRFEDLKQKTISIGTSGSTSNICFQQLAKDYGWRQNTDYIVQEQIPNPIQLAKLMGGRKEQRQLDAALIVDSMPSPVITQMMSERPDLWRLIPVYKAPNKKWDRNLFNMSLFSQQGNNNNYTSIITPLVLIGNTNYPSSELIQFASHIKNPFMFYSLQQVLTLYKLPIHPKSNEIYNSLGLLSSV